jgi:acetylornithine deacetylase/succinyl-diaminopimelate desuccinylase-like protein
MITPLDIVSWALVYASEHDDRFLDELLEFLRIPSVSTLPEHVADVQQAAEWLAGQMEAITLQNVRIMSTGGHPVVYGEWLGVPDRPTVLIYGHYDVQPPDPLDEWESPPFEPTVREGQIFARGASDDKGQLFAHLKAVESYLKTSGRLLVNVKFLIEGEEEVGSVNLGRFCKEHRDLLGADVAVISDTQMLGLDKPSIVFALRGLTYMEVEVRGPSHDLHSGSYGGAIHNPAQVLCEIIARLRDAQGRITIPGFYDDVRPLTEEERVQLARLPFDEAAFRDEAGVRKTWGEAGYTVLEQISARPTLDVNGLISGFTGEGAKTILPAWARAKVSMRLVTDQRSHDIAEKFRRYVESLTPDTVQLEIRELAGGEPAFVDPNIPEMQAAVRAYEAGFGHQPVFMREGASIPVVGMFRETLGLNTVLMGFGLPDDRLHAPNEKISLESFQRGIRTAIHFLSECRK